ncbi:MAG: site-specific DNA-methyltransferase, partial [Chloroflexi bacterium]|nr:site-specific DNA-methyltransferase [Chloroflexota bacterium]
MADNLLYYGDNLDILRHHVKDESVDLIYLDPPFNSNANYNVLFKETTGQVSAAQLQAFTDTWHWDLMAEKTFKEIVEDGAPQVAKMIASLQEFIGRNDMMAYLVMMTVRLIELRRVLKPTGSIYLHCDPTASHYLKIVLDTIFGKQSFRNEIVWKRFSGHGNVYRSFGRVHDTIFFYTKTDKWTWNQVYRPLSERYVGSFFRYVESGTGRAYRLQNVLNPNKNRPNLTYEWNGHVRVWKWTKEKMQELHDAGLLVYSKTGLPGLKQYLDESPGEKLHDLWDDIRPIGQSGDKNLGYQTQKPLALLERIIEASSSKGGVVLDPFCGCGSAVIAAHKLERCWIGIDITHLAITVMKRRLEDSFGLKPGKDYRVVGE